MVARAGCAQRGDCIGKPKLGEGDYVHIAFGHQGVTEIAHGLAGFEQAVEFSALAEYGCLRRVQIFGCAVAQNTPTETYAFAFDIANRKHDAVAKTVVAFFVFIAFLLGDDQAALHQ